MTRSADRTKGHLARPRKPSRINSGLTEIAELEANLQVSLRRRTSSLDPGTVDGKPRCAIEEGAGGGRQLPGASRASSRCAEASSPPSGTARRHLVHRHATIPARARGTRYAPNATPSRRARGSCPRRRPATWPRCPTRRFRGLLRWRPRLRTRTRDPHLVREDARRAGDATTSTTSECVDSATSGRSRSRSAAARLARAWSAEFRRQVPHLRADLARTRLRVCARP